MSLISDICSAMTDLSAFNLGRRNCLKVLAGGGTAGLAAFLMLRSGFFRESERFVPDADPRWRWLAFAALAPSAHNMQPWRVEWETEERLMVRVDGRGLLAAADPQGRQALISLGCFLELLEMAARQDGFRAVTTLFPEGEPLVSLFGNEAVAQVAFYAESIMPDPLFNAVTERRSSKQVFIAGRLPTMQVVQPLLRAASVAGVRVGCTLEPVQVRRIGACAAAAWQAEMENTTVVLEQLRLTRVGAAEVEAHRDGVAVQGLLPELASWLGLFRRDRVPEPGSVVAKKMLALGEVQAASAAGWVWLYGMGCSRVYQLAAGRAFVRLQLASAQAGLANQPMSQALERGPAMQRHFDHLHAMLGVDPSATPVQMLVRIGYAPAQPATVRWGVASFMKEMRA